MKKLEFFKKNLINPLSFGKCESIDSNELTFDCGSIFPIIKEIPIIIDESTSIFKIDSIIENTPTTQDINYRSESFKNKIRKRVLPSLSKDFSFDKRYKKLAEKFNEKSILVIGAGDKVDFYNKMFKDNLVITSDVHMQFFPDVVFDSHQIPFKDASFDFVIASQVLEHTFKPWEVANELQRVTKIDGRLLIEIPFNFPYHSPPYDFFRFTYTGLRSLFQKCELESFEASEGSASAVATFNAQFLIDLFTNRYLRMFMLFCSRFLFGWIKYLDFFRKRSTYNSTFSPMGFNMVFKRDSKKRTNNDLLKEYYDLKS